MHGTIPVRAIVEAHRAAGSKKTDEQVKESRNRLTRRLEQLEEREALRWWRLAATESDRQAVEILYGQALARCSNKRR